MESAAACGVSIDKIYIPKRIRDYLQLHDSLRFMMKSQIFGQSFFVNQNSYFEALIFDRIKFNPAMSRIFFTHKSDVGISSYDYSKYLNLCEKIFTYNSNDKKLLISMGINSDRVETVYGAVNRKIFYPMKEISEINLVYKHPYVLIAGDCKERKNPNLMLEIILQMPTYNFIIHGRGWKKFIVGKLKRVPKNLDILNFKFENQAKLIREASSYLSLSKLEGGPYPTLEALASGTPVLVTDTGWNSEIVNARSGFVVPTYFSVADVINKLKICIEMKKETWNTDLLDSKYTWGELGRKIFYLD